jgi:predicted nuclease with TOPRIM domain
MGDPTSVPWWATLVSGGGVGAIMLGIQRMVASRSRVEIGEQGVRKVEVREDSARQEREHGFAADAFAREREERQKISGERTALAVENAALIEEVGRVSAENIALKDRIEHLEADVRKLQDEVRECHDGRIDDMKRMTEWVQDALAGRRSEAPRPRSITPRDMPAIRSTPEDGGAV